jgi:hypothetical protein
MTMSVTGVMDEVVVLAREITELRERQDRLDAERASIDAQIADRMNRIAQAAVAAVTPASSKPSVQAADVPQEMITLGDAILMVLRQRPDKVLTALEIADLLKMTKRNDYSAVRTQLSRMARSGRVAKPAFGKYKTL